MYFSAKFDKNTKCIVLLFGLKLYRYLLIDILSKIQNVYFSAKFDKNTKCIVLPFDLKFYRYLLIDILSKIQSL